jgi:transcriptional regulator with XRE-family HTH domain
MKTRSRDEIQRIVSLWLYQTRFGLALQQTFVAEETGITRPQLSNYEKGKALPGLMSIIALADLYDVSIDFLVGRSENKFAHKTKREPFGYKED